MPAATIVVQERAHGATAWKTVRTLSAGVIGTLTGVLPFSIAPAVSTDYQFVHPSAPYGPLGSPSAVVTTLVAQKLTARLSSTRVPTGSYVVLSGGVFPSKAGHLVSVQRYSAGAWRTFTNLKLTSTSTYRLSLKAARGSVSYRVVRAADQTNTAGASPVVVLTGS